MVFGAGVPVLGSIAFLLIGGNPPDAESIVTFALIGLVLGYVLWRRQPSPPD